MLYNTLFTVMPLKDLQLSKSKSHRTNVKKALEQMLSHDSVWISGTPQALVAHHTRDRCAR